MIRRYVPLALVAGLLAGCSSNGEPIKIDPVSAAIGGLSIAKVAAQGILLLDDCKDGQSPIKDRCVKHRTEIEFAIPVVDAAIETMKPYRGSTDSTIIDQMQDVADKALETLQKANGD